MRTRILLAGSLIALIGCMFLFFNKNTSQPDHPGQVETGNPVAYVNGIPVEKEEMSLMMQLSGMVGDGLQSTNITDNQAAVNRMVEIKTAQQTAVKYGVLKDSSFSAFLKELDQENERRANALGNKEAIYGPRQYSKLTYYDYRHTLMMNALKLAWSKQGLDMDESKLLDYYDQHRESIAKKHDTIQVYRIIQAKTQPEQAKRNIYEIRQKLKTEEAFQELFHQLEQEQGLTEIETIQEDNYKEISKYRSDYYHLVSELVPGEVSRVIEDPDSYSIVMIKERKPGGYASFADIREEVVQQYIDDGYASFLKQQMAGSEVRLLN